MVRHKRATENPVAEMGKLSVETDRRHDRRELTAAELQKLLGAVMACKHVTYGLSGRDRGVLYALAAGTGLRAAALASLTPENFDLNNKVPTVTVAAQFNKNRKLKIQPLPPELAAMLRDFLTGRPANRPLWEGNWAKKGRSAEMLRIDLEAAGIPYVVQGPDGPLYADFHALRHSFLTLLGKGGVDLHTVQELAGHSTPILTMRYSHRRLADLAGAVEKLPTFLPELPQTQEGQSLRPTGTDGAPAVERRENVLASCLALSERSEKISVDSNGLDTAQRSEALKSETPAENVGFSQENADKVSETQTVEQPRAGGFSNRPTGHASDSDENVLADCSALLKHRHPDLAELLRAWQRVPIDLRQRY
jgi:site-specific recombinase XerD